MNDIERDIKEVHKQIKSEAGKMSANAKIEDIVMPIFDGVNFGSWKFRLMTILEYKECKEPAVRARTTEDNETTWTKTDLKAKTILISTISDKQLEYVSECQTTLEIMNKLNEMYSTKSTALQILCRGKIDEIKLKDYETVEEFFIEFEKAVNKFKNAGGTIDENEKMRYLLKALPTSYSYIGDFLDVIPEAQRTVEYVKSKVKEKSLNRGPVDRQNNVSTFNTKTKKECYACGKTGHLQRDCWHAEQNARGENKQQQQYNRRYQNTNQRGGRGRGQHHGNGRGRGTGRGHYSGDGNQGRQQENSDGVQSWTIRMIRNEKIINCNNSESSNETTVNWLLDSGCTDHIINDCRLFKKCVNLKNPIDVKVADGKQLQATKIGNVETYFKTYNNENLIDIKNVYFVKGIKQNLLSISKITENKCTVVARNNDIKIYNEKRELLTVANKIDSLYNVKSFMLKNKTNEIYTNVTKLTEKEKWHRALGHVNFQYLNRIIKNKMLDGLPDKIENTEMKCANCIQSKMSNEPFENNRKKTKETLELIHTDLNGPHSTTGYCGEKYFLTFVDDFSKCARIYCIKHKSETASCLKEYVNYVENQFSKKVKQIQCDNGKEYMNREILNFVKYKGIQLTTCPPYVHELNGVAERYNRSAMDIGRCLMREANIHRRYWPEVMNTVAYLKNRTIANTAVNKSPYEIFFGIKPNVENLKIYGSRVFVRVPEVRRQSKWDNKSELGVLVGYNTNGYRVLVNNRVINARHVQVVEEKTKLICLEKNKQDDNENEINENEEDDEDNAKTDDLNDMYEDNSKARDDSESEENKEHLTVQRTSNRDKRPVNLYGNPVTHFIYINYVNAIVPNTYEEAMNSNEKKEWLKAMNTEMQCLNKNNTWRIVEKPINKKIIDVKWVYKKKSDGTYKARLVVRGFQQKERLENVYSPVGKMQTLKILLSYCCKNGMYINQMDVETAFLNGYVKSEVYVNEPKGYETGENKVYKLIKALYGLRESPRAWYECLHKYLDKLNFIRSNYDNCLYVKRNDKDEIYILVFVDDILICSKNKTKIIEIKDCLMNKFTMKDLGKIGSYIGIDINYSTESKKMTLNQKAYIESLAIKYNLENAKLYDTPMETNLKLDQATECDENIKYRNLIGELLYISAGTRPDISYSVNYLSRYQSCYNSTHYKYALRVLKYLYKTRDLNLTFEDNKNNEFLDCMVDSDYAGDNVDRKSTTGFIIRMYGNTVYWKTHKQQAVTKCSTFAEYIALSEAVTEILFVKNMLCEMFNINNEKAIKIYEDNSGAVAIAKFGNFTKNSKHIEVQYHYVNENYEKGIIDIVKIESKLNIADMLTKALDKQKFIRNRNAVKLM